MSRTKEEEEELFFDLFFFFFFLFFFFFSFFFFSKSWKQINFAGGSSVMKIDSNGTTRWSRGTMPKRWSRLLIVWTIVQRGDVWYHESLEFGGQRASGLVELARATFILQPLTPLPRFFFRTTKSTKGCSHWYQHHRFCSSSTLLRPLVCVIHSLSHYVIGFSLHPERYRAGNLSTRLATADPTKNYFSNGRNFFYLDSWMNFCEWSQEWKGWKTSFPDIYIYTDHFRFMDE